MERSVLTKDGEGFREFKDGTCGTLRAMNACGDKVVAISTRRQDDRFYEGATPCLNATDYKDMHKVAIPCHITR